MEFINIMGSKQVQKILIIKPSALGDIAQSLPALTSLRISFPDAEISWLVRKEFAPLLELADDITVHELAQALTGTVRLERRQLSPQAVSR